MTVTNSARKTIAQGNGALTSFAFSFVWVDPNDFYVIYTSPAGIETQLSPSQYTVTFNPASPGQLWGVGGTVTYQLPGPTPIPAGSTLTMYRELDDTQEVRLTNQASFGQLAKSTEEALDLNTMLIQQIAEQQGRAITVPIVDEDPPLPLPAVAQRALLWMAFDADGNPIAAAGPSGSVPISSAMQPVVAAATLALARTALGLGGLSVLGMGAGLQNDGSNNARVFFDTTAVATNQAIGAASHLIQYMATGPITFTLARANTLWDGFGFWVYALAGTITLTPNAADTIRGRASGQSFAIPAGSAAWVTTDAASAGTWTIGWMPQLNPVFDCQLSLSGGNLLLSRFGGRSIFINGINEIIPTSGPTLAATGLTPSTLYYIYCFMNGTVMTLEASTTVPTTDTTYGHQIKTGDATRSLVGMGRPIAGPAWVSSATQRFVRSYYNEASQTLTNAFTATRSTSATGGYVEINTEIRCEFLTWANEVVDFSYTAISTNNSTGATNFNSLGFDGSITANPPSSMQAFTAGGGDSSSSRVLQSLAVGYHYATLLGFVGNGTGSWNNSTRITGLLRR